MSTQKGPSSWRDLPGRWPNLSPSERHSLRVLALRLHTTAIDEGHTATTWGELSERHIEIYEAAALSVLEAVAADPSLITLAAKAGAEPQIDDPQMAKLRRWNL